MTLKHSLLPALCSLLLLSGIPPKLQAQDEDPPEIVVGEALFLETRFAEYFARNADEVNQELPRGDPVMNATRTTTGDLFGPFRGTSMNCRACHLVDEHAETDERLGAPQGGMRSYADFAQRSQISRREDGKSLTLRNSPSQVNASVEREFMLFHFDGEFVSLDELVKGTFKGRNFGWLTGEEDIALEHLARVIKEDNGKHPLAEEDPHLTRFSYATILKGTDPELPAEITLREEFRIDVSQASDEEILNAVAKLITAYVNNLAFSQDEDGYDSSPYDVFLRKNGLSTKPAEGETPLEYGRRLRSEVEALQDPKFVTPADHDPFNTHDQLFQFGPTELDGLKTFLQEPPEGAGSADLAASGGIGNCIACHQPPHFANYLFHNTGVAQEEYDSVHGEGEFATIDIPDYEQRQQNYRRYLPLKAQHPPVGSGPFADIPSLDEPGQTDLGLWNVFRNPAIPGPQERLEQLLRKQYPDVTEPSELLEKTVAAFKTPGIRDLGHSNPYFHTGRFGQLENVVQFYRRFSDLARQGNVRNADRELYRVYLQRQDVSTLAAFLRTLNEDYD